MPDELNISADVSWLTSSASINMFFFEGNFSFIFGYMNSLQDAIGLLDGLIVGLTVVLAMCLKSTNCLNLELGDR